MVVTADRRGKKAAYFPESNKERKREDGKAWVFHETAHHSALRVARMKSGNASAVRKPSLLRRAYTLTVNVNHAPHLGEHNGRLLLTLANCKPGIRSVARKGEWVAAITPKKMGYRLAYLMRVGGSWTRAKSLQKKGKKK